MGECGSGYLAEGLLWTRQQLVETASAAERHISALRFTVLFVSRRFAPAVSDKTEHQRCRFLSGKQAVSDCSFAVKTLTGTRNIF
jgi:hypothetical protein